MVDEKILRINALVKKSKEVGLTEEEQAEQKRLREEYVASFRESLRAQLEGVTVVNPDGSSYRLREKKK